MPYLPSAHLTSRDSPRAGSPDFEGGRPPLSGIVNVQNEDPCDCQAPVSVFTGIAGRPHPGRLLQGNKV